MGTTTSSSGPLKKLLLTRVLTKIKSPAYIYHLFLCPESFAFSYKLCGSFLSTTRPSTGEQWPKLSLWQSQYAMILSVVECGWIDPCVCCTVGDLPRLLCCWRSLRNVDGLIHVFVCWRSLGKLRWRARVSGSPHATSFSRYLREFPHFQKKLRLAFINICEPLIEGDRSKLRIANVFWVRCHLKSQIEKGKQRLKGLKDCNTP